MAHNPYLAPELQDPPRPVPPRRVHVEDQGSWLSLALAIALLIGVTYYFFGHTVIGMRDSGTITYAEPSQN